jgi:CubicO group peptidase (beta-lactamase class C family)
LDQHELQAAIDDACRKYKVPGASAAICVDDRVHLAVCGTANIATGVEMTTDTVMHIGSITKVINATLLMQLVDQGRVALERPVLDYLPNFRVKDAEATRSITVEMLLNHTAGIDGDLLPALDHDDETIARTIQRMADLTQIHAPGHGRSYCNPGTVVAGYLCQQIARTSWYDLVKERIFKELGMEHAAVLPEDALLYRASVGHFLDRISGKLYRTSHAFLPIGYAPAGSTAMMSANDLMAFTRLHLANGATLRGKRVLSAQSAEQMRRRSGPLDGPEPFQNGLGWRLDGEFIMHGGGGPGIVSLAIAHFPSQTAAVVLTNAEHGLPVIIDVVGSFLKSRLGLDAFPAPPRPTGEAVATARYVGTYRSINTVHEVEARNGKLKWASYSTQKYYDSSPLSKPEPTPLIAAGHNQFLADSRVSTMPSSDTAVVSFVEPDANGKMKYLVENLWLFPRHEPEH